jgi:lysophospholipase
VILTYPDVTLKTRRIVSSRFGWKLRTGHWLTTTDQKCAVILPGRGDFLEKYTGLAAMLSMRGYAVYSLDWPGQGGSERLAQHPQAGHIDSYEDYVVVFEEFLEMYSLMSQPAVWISYSMGSLIALLTLAARRYSVDRLVLLSPMFGFPDNLPEPLVHTLAAATCWLGLARHFAIGEQPTNVSSWRFSRSQVSSDATSFEVFKTFLSHHPEYVFGGSTWGWVKASLEAFYAVRRLELAQLHLPILHIAAQDEQTVSRKWAAYITGKLPNITSYTLPSKHDLLLGGTAVTDRLFHYIDTFITKEP